MFLHSNFYIVSLLPDIPEPLISAYKCINRTSFSIQNSFRSRHILPINATISIFHHRYHPFESLCVSIDQLSVLFHELVKKNFPSTVYRVGRARVIFGGGLVLLCLLLLLSFKFCILRHSSPSLTTNGDILALRRHHIHSALSSFIVPTPIARSRFPPNFLRFQSPRSTQQYDMELDLSSLFIGLFTGKLEFRGLDSSSTSMNSIVSLLLGTLNLKIEAEENWGHLAVRLNIGRKMWTDVVSWVALSYAGPTITPAPPTVNRSQLDSETTTHVLDLDLVPYASLERTIKTFIRYFSSQAAGYVAAVEFTVLAPHVRCLSREFVLASTAFMYSGTGKQGENIRPNATPMLLSLKHVVEILTSLTVSQQEGSASIKSIKNSSVEYTATLLSIEQAGADGGETQSLTEDDERRMRIMRVWQAALLKAGLLQRWVVALESEYIVEQISL